MTRPSTTPTSALERPQLERPGSGKVIAMAALAFMLLALFSASGTYWNFQGGGEPIPWTSILVVSTIGTLPWFLATPWILRLALRFPMYDRRWIRSLPIHLLASLVVLAVASVASESGRTLLLGEPLAGIVGRTLTPTRGWLWIDWLMYWVILGAATAWILILVARSLRHDLVRARMDALQARLEPHFLFNALNGIQGLIRTGDPDMAAEMVARLGELLRSALSRDRSPWTDLDREINHMLAYLEIERLRIGDRLTLETDLDPKTNTYLLPTLLLQPLAENAIRHGVRYVSGEATVRVRSRRSTDGVRIVIENDGPMVDPTSEWIPPNPSELEGPTHGLGLKITRERLNRAYEGRARLRLERRSNGGMTVTLDLPTARPGDSPTREPYSEASAHG